ncbi:hypothetical protein ACHAWF_008794 [Thalassiosira exigua]
MVVFVDVGFYESKAKADAKKKFKLRANEEDPLLVLVTKAVRKLLEKDAPGKVIDDDAVERAVGRIGTISCDAPGAGSRDLTEFLRDDDATLSALASSDATNFQFKRRIDIELPREAREGAESVDALGAEAFAVYEKQIATEVAVENARLEKQLTVRCRPLHSLVNKVELRASDGQVIPFRGLDAATPSSNGHGEECCCFPGPVQLSIPLRQLAKDQGTKLFVSNQCAGNFPASLSPPKIIDVDREEKHLTMEILDDMGTVSITGRATNLRDEDFWWLVGRQDGEGCTSALMGWLQAPDDWTWSPDAVFTPTHVWMLTLVNGHPEIGRTIRILQRRLSSDIVNQSPSPLDKSRMVRFSVNRNNHNRMLMQNHMKMKSEIEKLNGVQEIFEAIELYEDTGDVISIDVRSGFSLEGDGWSVALPSSCDCINLRNLPGLQVSVSGVRLRKSGGRLSDPYSFNENSGLQFYSLFIEFDEGITLIGCLDMGREMSQNQIEIIESRYISRVLSDVINGDQVQFPPLPGSTFCLRSIHFNYRWDTIMRDIWSLDS